MTTERMRLRRAESQRRYRKRMHVAPYRVTLGMHVVGGAVGASTGRKHECVSDVGLEF